MADSDSVCLIVILSVMFALLLRKSNMILSKSIELVLETVVFIKLVRGGT